MRELQMGVYRLYDAKTSESFVGFSRNLAGIKKRLLFELKLNACPYTDMQRRYNQCGGLSFEVLHTYEPPNGETDEELDAHLLGLLEHYRQQYASKPIR